MFNNVENKQTNKLTNKQTNKQTNKSLVLQFSNLVSSDFALYVSCISSLK